MCKLCFGMLHASHCKKQNPPWITHHVKQFVSVCILSSDRIQPSSISGLLSIPWTQAAPASASKSPTCPSLSCVEQHCTFSTQKGKTGLHVFVIGRSGNIHGIMAWIHHPQTQFNGWFREWLHFKTCSWHMIHHDSWSPSPDLACVKSTTQLLLPFHQGHWRGRDTPFGPVVPQQRQGATEPCNPSWVQLGIGMVNGVTSNSRDLPQTNREQATRNGFYWFKVDSTSIMLKDTLKVYGIRYNYCALAEDKCFDIDIWFIACAKACCPSKSNHLCSKAWHGTFVLHQTTLYFWEVTTFWQKIPKT